MKLALLLALSLVGVGVLIVAPAPEATACYTECRVGPCSVYQWEAYRVEEPVTGRSVRVSQADAECRL